MRTCEEHRDSIVVYESYDCPVCDIIEDMETEHAKTVDDLETQVSEADDRIVEPESELEEAKK